MAEAKEASASDWSDVGRLRSAHYAAFLIVYGTYGYQVCPYLESLSLWELLAPAAVVLAAQLGARA